MSKWVHRSVTPPLPFPTTVRRKSRACRRDWGDPFPFYLIERKFTFFILNVCTLLSLILIVGAGIPWVQQTLLERLLYGEHRGCVGEWPALQAFLTALSQAGA